MTQEPGLGTPKDLPSTETHTACSPLSTYCVPGPLCNSPVNSLTCKMFSRFQTVLAQSPFLFKGNLDQHSPLILEDSRTKLTRHAHDFIFDSFVINIPLASHGYLAMAHDNVSAIRTRIRRQPRNKAKRRHLISAANS